MRAIWLLAASVVLAQTPAQQARGLMERKQFNDAAKLYSDLAKAMPGDAGLRMNLGLALHMAGRDAECIAPFEAALKLNPRLAPAWIGLGASYLRLGQPAKAIAPLERFAALQPADLEARKMLVDATLSTGQPVKAIPHLERLAAADAAQPGLWYELGRAYEAAAQADFQELAQRFPESGPFFALAADSRSKGNQRRAAFFFYRKALEKAPAMRGLRASIAEIYRLEGQPSWALSEEAAEAKLPPLRCGVKTAECEFAAGRFAAARALADRSAMGLYWRIRAANELARDSFAKLMALPASVDGFRFLAEQARAQNRHSEAAEAWRAARRLEPENANLKRELAATLLDLKDYKEAQKLTDALLAAEPKAPDVNLLAGEIALAQQLAEQAIPYFAASVQGDPDFLPARASYARALILAGRPAEALPHATAALALDSDGSLHFQLAQAYRAAGKAEEAQKTLATYQEIRSRMRAQDQFLEEEVKIAPPR
jgi:predicted Zn-dependent protease